MQDEVVQELNLVNIKTIFNKNDLLFSEKEE